MKIRIKPKKEQDLGRQLMALTEVRMPKALRDWLGTQKPAKQPRMRKIKKTRRCTWLHDG